MPANMPQECWQWKMPQITLNKVRQATITTEMLEIVSGAEALQN